MKNTIFFIVIGILFNLNLIAQSPNWVWAKSTNGSYNDHKVLSMCADLNGNTYITGYFNDSIITFDTITIKRHGVFDMFLAKYNSLGNVQWVKQYYNGSGISLKMDINENINVLCWFDSLMWNYQRSVFVAKFDTVGNMLGVKHLFPLQHSGNFYQSSFAIDNSCNFFLSGDFQDTLQLGNFTFISNSTSGSNLNFFIAKFDTSGNVIWANSYGVWCGCQQMGLSIDKHSNVIILGPYCDSIIFGNTTLSGGYFFITKFDSSGHVIWAKSPKRYLIGTGPSIYYSIIDSSSNIYTTGNGPGIFDNDTISIQCPYLVKYDSSGNVKWGKNLTNTNWIAGSLLTLDYSGNIYVGCNNDNQFSASSNIFGQDTISHKDMFISKCDSSGNLIWTIGAGHHKNSSNGGDGFTSIQIDNSGDNIFVAGESDADTASFGNINLNYQYPGNGFYEIFVAKLSTNNLTGINKISDESEVKIFPNPSKRQIFIRIPNETTDIEIFDLYGRNISKNQVRDKKEIMIEFPHSGVYLLKTNYKKGFITKKIIIEK